MRAFLFSLWKIPAELWAWFKNELNFDEEFFKEIFKVSFLEIFKILFNKFLVSMSNKFNQKKPNDSDVELSK